MSKNFYSRNKVIIFNKLNAGFFQRNVHLHTIWIHLRSPDITSEYLIIRKALCKNLQGKAICPSPQDVSRIFLLLRKYYKNFLFLYLWSCACRYESIIHIFLRPSLPLFWALWTLKMSHQILEILFLNLNVGSIHPPYPHAPKIPNLYISE